MRISDCSSDVCSSDLRFRLIAWLRDDKMRSDLGKDNPLLSGDVLVVEASADALASFHDDPGIMLAPVARHGGKANDKEAQLVQAVIGPGSEFIGRSIRELEYESQVEAVIAGLSPERRRVGKGGV